mgnify:FL=1
MAANVSFVAFQGWQLLFYDQEGIDDPAETIRRTTGEQLHKPYETRCVALPTTTTDSTLTTTEWLLERPSEGGLVEPMKSPCPRIRRGPLRVSVIVGIE